MNKEVEEAIDRVYEELSAIPQEEFHALLKTFRDHYICAIFDETQALETRIVEAECFADSPEIQIGEPRDYTRDYIWGGIIDSLVATYRYGPVFVTDSLAATYQSGSVFVTANNEYLLSSKSIISATLLSSKATETYSIYEHNKLPLAA